MKTENSQAYYCGSAPRN